MRDRNTAAVKMKLIKLLQENKQAVDCLVSNSRLSSCTNSKRGKKIYGIPACFIQSGERCEAKNYEKSYSSFKSPNSE